MSDHSEASAMTPEERRRVEEERMADDRSPSPMEIQRVREWECKMSGHAYTVIEVEQSHHPQNITCTNCGETWAVMQKLP